MDLQDRPILLLCPDGEPVESGYLYARYAVPVVSGGLPVVKGLQAYYYAANSSMAAELLTNQIKPTLAVGECYAVTYPISDSAEVLGTHTRVNLTAAIVHFSLRNAHTSEAEARRHVLQLLGHFQQAQQRYITGVQLLNTDFAEWSDDNSEVHQYTALVSLTAIFPNFNVTNC